MTAVDISTKVAGTDVRLGDLALIGEALLNLATTVPLMRHTSPIGSLDYAEVPDALPFQIVRDFTLWSSPNPGVAREAGGRLARYLNECGWTDRRLSVLGGAA